MKKIVFLTATRADYGKLKCLIRKVDESDKFECFIFVTGMHMLSKYGSTHDEIRKDRFNNSYRFINQISGTKMDVVLANTILGFTNFVHETKPDMIVIHGDRLEPLAAAIVGTFNNILVAHIEGGEVSGTVDEIIRHSITKLAHLHFVSNHDAKKRVFQLGEQESSIFIIGSPDIDIMQSGDLPHLKDAKKYYDVTYRKYAIFIFHPVTSELFDLEKQISTVVKALMRSKKNFIVIYPNNDEGSDIILNEYKKLQNNRRFRIFSSTRFEHFLTFLKNADFVIGNSSAGVREAMVYGVPSINIGTRQNCRLKNFEQCNVFNVEPDEKAILAKIQEVADVTYESVSYFGDGNSVEKFYRVISDPKTWHIHLQKTFNDLIDY